MGALVITAGVRSGRFGDRHLTVRSQRPLLIGVVVGLVVAALAVLVVFGAPMVMVACVAVMLATLAVVGPITLWWKVSFHTAVSAGSVVMLAEVLPPVWVYAVGAVVVAAIGWSRVALADHTAGQVVAGGAAGAGASWVTLAVLL
ncbi:hypothetical protein [Sinosporangium album]|uniref:hypothetical protein n=1 Tax=Sinosporangium album TaxID=504805 RepID=UPI001FDF4212|nr:hypothetical protein [Sinosporangium album]